MSEAVRAKAPPLEEEVERMRDLKGPLLITANLIAALFSIFYIYTGGFGLISTETHRGLYLLFTAILGFMLYPMRKSSSSGRVAPGDLILCLMAIFSIGYWIVVWPSYAYRTANPNNMDILAGIITIALVIELARRVLGPVLPSMAVAFLLYAYFGKYMPGHLAHAGYPMKRIIEFMACGMDSIYGVVIHVYATFVFLFILFAAFLQEAGAGDFIRDLANSVAGGSRGGPAKIAVVASGIMGSITGSSAANVVATGAYTIPLMKRAGYRPHVAGAVEAAASTGGQFMPPVMGAGAFILAAFTETAYAEIMLISVIPAILYFLSVGTMVHFEAAREGLVGLPKDQLPSFRKTMRRGGYLLIPIVVILVLLLMGRSPNMAAFGAIVVTVLLSYLRKETRMGPKKIQRALIVGARNSLIVGATAGVIGIIIGVTVLTGLGLKFSSLILSMSQGILPLAVLLTAVVSYILGMGVTVTAAYILLAVLAVPALMEFGIPLIAAHLIVFWYSQSAQVTPPVALAAFAASGIARSDPTRTGFAALRMASPLLITPLIFIYNTPILLEGQTAAILEAALSSALGFIAFASMVQAYWYREANLLERVLMGGAAFSLFAPGLKSDFLGLALMVAVTFIQKFRR